MRESSILSATGRGYFLLCALGGADEPTVHALGQLEDCSDTLNEWGCKVLVLGGCHIPALKNAVYGTDSGGKIVHMLRQAVESSRKDLPVIALCDSFGRIIYCSEGYDTALSSRLTSLCVSMLGE